MTRRDDLVPGPVLAMFLALVVGALLGYSAPTADDAAQVAGHDAGRCEAAP